VSQHDMSTQKECMCQALRAADQDKQLDFQWPRHMMCALRSHNCAQDKVREGAEWPELRSLVLRIATVCMYGANCGQR
jgi:hypothetical protein